MSRGDKDLCDHYEIIFNSSYYAFQRHKFTVLNNLNNTHDFLIEKGIFGKYLKNKEAHKIYFRKYKENSISALMEVKRSFILLGNFRNRKCLHILL